MGIGNATATVGLINLRDQSEHWQGYYYFPIIEIHHRVKKQTNVIGTSNFSQVCPS